MDNGNKTRRTGTRNSEQLKTSSDGREAAGIDRAYHVLKQDIIKCVLPPGSRVSEAKLSERYGIGRASVRTALTRLAQDGLVRVAPREGYFIEDITLKEARDVFETRLLLEPPTARLAAERISRNAVEQLEELAAYSFDDADPHEKVNRVLSRNKEIHVAIAAASDNAYVASIIAQMFDRNRRMLQLHNLVNLFRKQEHEFRVPSHEAIINALSRRDGEMAEQLMHEHLVLARQHLMDALSGHPSLMNVNLQAPIDLE